MSFFTSPVLCSKCKDAMAIMTCYGCEHKFCHKDYLEHYEKVSDDVEKLKGCCQAFAETLDCVEPHRKAMAHIDEWEQKSYQIIAEAAARARADIQKLSETTKTDIKIGTVNMKADIETKWTKKNFSETDIKLWNQKLGQMKTLQQEEFAVIEVSDDHQYKPLHMIKVVTKDTLRKLLCESEIDKISTHVKYNPVSGSEKILKNGRSSMQIQTKHHNICAMNYYEKVSMEELRFKYYFEISPPRESIQFVSLFSGMSILSDTNSEGKTITDSCSSSSLYIASTGSKNDRSSSILSLKPSTSSLSTFTFGAKPSTSDQPPFTFGAKPPTSDQPPFTFGAKPPTSDQPPFTFGAKPPTSDQRSFLFGENPLTTSTGPSTTSKFKFNFSANK